ncbi:MAG: chromosome partitioning protein ParB [Proteobacteria bacterium]|nr:chromosome partitioning protein ParB [Pseudomonadota bacterium]
MWIQWICTDARHHWARRLLDSPSQCCCFALVCLPRIQAEQAVQAHHPLLSIAPKKLRPTQVTVGMAEVQAKREQWSQLGKKKRRQLLASHWFPGVLGPKRGVYIVDHHHLGLALTEEDVDEVPVMIQRDFSWLEPEMFWRTMEFNRWAHPYDQHGARMGYEAIPASLDKLVDDPYRTLAARVREAGGYSKDAIPYAEFMWAEFYRRRLKLRGGEIPGKAMQEATLLARSHEAAFLPGWAGTIA